MILASVLITSDNIEGDGSPPAVDKLPRKIQENIVSFWNYQRELQYLFFGHHQIRALLSQNFGVDVLKAYDTLRPYAFKADLARLCIIYLYGGVYADIGCLFLARWPSLDLDRDRGKPRLCVFRDFASSSTWDTSQTMFSAPQGHPALAKAIELICAHVKSRYYGATSLCPTGPTCFGKAIATTCEPEDLLVGDSRPVRHKFSPEEPEGHYHGFVFADTVIGVKRKRSVSLAELGLATGNDYLHLWSEKAIYDD